MYVCMYACVYVCVCMYVPFVPIRGPPKSGSKAEADFGFSFSFGGSGFSLRGVLGFVGGPDHNFRSPLALIVCIATIDMDIVTIVVFVLIVINRYPQPGGSR